MDKNPATNAGDTGSIPGAGEFHMRLSLCGTTTEAVCWSRGSAMRGHRSEKPMHRRQGAASTHRN